MESAGDTMEIDELTCTETAVDVQSVDGGISCEEDHVSAGAAGGPGTSNGHSQHLHSCRQNHLNPQNGQQQQQQTLRQKFLQRDGTSQLRLHNENNVAVVIDNNGHIVNRHHDGEVVNGETMVQGPKWKETDDGHEMRGEGSIEEEGDDVEESIRGGNATASSTNGTNGQKDQAEPPHLPGEYQFQLLPIHVQQRGDARTGVFKVFKCDICAMVYRHVFSLKRHFLRCHINYKYLTATDITNCGIHLQVIQAAQSSTMRNGDHLYRCHVCNNLFAQREQLRQHMETHTTGKEKRAANGVACSKCSSAFTDRKSLLRHQQTAHGLTSGATNGASNASSSNGRTGHSSTTQVTGTPMGTSSVANKKSLSCRHCGKIFIGSQEARTHERLHEAVDTTCRVCNRKFSSNEWVIHKTSTHPDSNHICSYCDILLPDVGALGQHLFQAHNKTYSENMRLINDKENGNCSLQLTQTAGASGGVGGGNSAISGGVHVKSEPGTSGVALESRPDRPIDTTVSCEQCNKSFTSLVNLQRHNTVVHIKQLDKRSPQEQKSRAVSSSNSSNNQRSPSEEEFYRTLGHRISENLQYHIDGRLPGSSQASAFEPERVEANNCMPWLVNNFPPTLDITHIVQIYANRPALSSTNAALTAHPISAGLVAPESAAPPGEEQIALGACLGLNPVVKKEIKRESLTLFICQVCSCTATSLREITEHKMTNHPNVVATHLELEGHSSAPPELLMQFGANMRPSGILGQSTTPAVVRSTSGIHKCTKCSRMFGRTSDLHSHIVQCGQAQGVTSLGIQRPSSPRQIKQRKFGPVLNTKRCDDGSSTMGGPLNGTDYGKEDPRRKRKPEDRPQRRSARSTYNGGSSECSTCGQSFPSQASLRKHMLDECREEQSYRRRKKKDKDSPTATPTPELIKVPATGGVDGWGEDYLDGKGPEQLQCRDCSATFPSLQVYKRHLSQCPCSAASRQKTLLLLRTAESSDVTTTGSGVSPLDGTTRVAGTGGGMSSMNRSQFEEMTMLGLARRAERDRQRDGATDRDRDENGDVYEDEEDTKVYRCETCQMGFGDYVKMLHHSMHEHGAPIPEVSDMREARELAGSRATHQNGLQRNGHALQTASNYSNNGASRKDYHRLNEMHEEQVQDHKNETEYQNQPPQLSIYDSEDLRDKERIAIEALSAICGAGSFFGGFSRSNNNNNNNDDSNKFPNRHPQPLMDHRY